MFWLFSKKNNENDEPDMETKQQREAGYMVFKGIVQLFLWISFFDSSSTNHFCNYPLK